MSFYLSTRWLVGLGIKWPVKTWLDWQVKYAKYVIPIMAIMAIRKRAKSIIMIAVLIATMPVLQLRAQTALWLAYVSLSSNAMSSKQTNMLERSLRGTLSTDRHIRPVGPVS